jgi:hypothetical protein
MEWFHEQRADAANPDADVVQTPLTVNSKANDSFCTFYIIILIMTILIMV